MSKTLGDNVSDELVDETDWPMAQKGARCVKAFPLGLNQESGVMGKARTGRTHEHSEAPSKT